MLLQITCLGGALGGRRRRKQQRPQMRRKRVHQRSTGNVKRQAVQPCVLCALPVLLRGLLDVLKMATRPDGITFPVENIFVMNTLTIIIEE
uniref:uncharacterized protein LOC123455579 isoform X4 n=1 Tax=Jaculus jaculus TaxID=51337 RepID=UPI001E1B5318|nr:uncharacterized protein LOC123455579 isoform X4 [Jaculus jaculus]